MTFGAIYTVNASHFIPLAKHSIKSLRKVSDMPVTVCCRDRWLKEFLDCDVSLQKISKKYLRPPEDAKKQEKPQWWFYCKFFSFRLMPYDINIVIDADTEFLKDPRLTYKEGSDLSAALEYHADWENKKFFKLYDDTFNSGLMTYKKSEKIKNFFSAAEHHYVYENTNYYHADQASINILLRGKFKNVIKVNVLDGKWNIRLPLISSTQNPYMLHAHHLDEPSFVEQESQKWQ